MQTTVSMCQCDDCKVNFKEKMRMDSSPSVSSLGQPWSWPWGQVQGIGVGGWRWLPSTGQQWSLCRVHGVGVWGSQCHSRGQTRSDRDQGSNNGGRRRLGNLITVGVVSLICVLGWFDPICYIYLRSGLWNITQDVAAPSPDFSAHLIIVSDYSLLQRNHTHTSFLCVLCVWETGVCLWLLKHFVLIISSSYLI